MLDFLVTAFQILAVPLLLAGFLVGRYIRQRNAAQAAERRAAAAEAAAARAQEELLSLRSGLSVAELHAVERYRVETAPLENPPAGFDAIIAELERLMPDDPYGVFLGWQRVAGRPHGVAGSLDGNSDAAISNAGMAGETGYGKDVQTANMLYPLLARNPPSRLRIAVLEGKGPDGALFDGLAHNWVEPCFGETAAPLMAALRLERMRREKLLIEHRKTKWESLPADVRPPLLLVYIAELRLLDGVVEGDFQKWLAVELAAVRAAGIRYLVGVQSLNGLNTAWRDQCGLKLSAYLGAWRQVEPALGLLPDEIRKKGGISPDELPGKGYFTIRFESQVLTVRSSYVSDDDRIAFLDSLPRAARRVRVDERQKELAAWWDAFTAKARDEREREPAPTHRPAELEEPPEAALPARPARVIQLPPRIVVDGDALAARGFSVVQIERAERVANERQADIRRMAADGRSRNEMADALRPLEKRVALAAIAAVLAGEPEPVEEAV